MEAFAKVLTRTFQQLKRDNEDSGKRTPEGTQNFNGSFIKFRRWWELIKEYFAIHEKRVRNDQTKIYSMGTFLPDQAAYWYAKRVRLVKALHLDDNWVAFSADMEEWFTDQQGMGKDNEKLLFLKYSDNMETYLAFFNELNSRIQLIEQSFKQVLTAAVTLVMYRKKWRKYGNYPDSDRDLLQAV